MISECLRSRQISEVCFQPCLLVAAEMDSRFASFFFGSFVVMIRNSLALPHSIIAVAFPRVFSRSRKCGRLAILCGLLAVIAGWASNAGVAQTASFSYGIALLGGISSEPEGIAVDSSGKVYLAEPFNNAVQEMPAGCNILSCMTTLGGGFNYPTGVAVDSRGNVYVADHGNSAVKEMPAGCASASCVTTLGGGFSEPEGVAVNGTGNVYVADSSNNAVKEMPAGCASSSCVTTLGGGFSDPQGVAVDASGNVYVGDYYNNAVKQMPAGCSSSSCVTTLGSGFSVPRGVAVDSSGNVYVADYGNSAVKEMPAGCASASCVTTLGGGFVYPFGVAVDASGNVYAAYPGSWATEIMTRGVNLFTVPLGLTTEVRTLTFTIISAGSLYSTPPYQVLTLGAKSLDFNAAATQGSNACNSTTAYTAGDVCTVDVTFTPTRPGPRDGAVELLDARGNIIATASIYGAGNGPQVVFSPSTQISLGGGFLRANGAAVDGNGNIYVADTSNYAVKEMPAGCASSSCVTKLAAGFGFAAPSGVAVDGSGNVYVADGGWFEVLEIQAGCASALCVTKLGGGFGGPAGVAVDGSGNVYVADAGTNAVKEMPAGCTSSNCVTTLGGGFSIPEGVALDGSGNIYVADYGHNAVKEMPAGCASSNCVTTLGGGFISPTSVAVDASGNVYVGSAINNVVNVMPAGCASSSCVTTVGSGFTFPRGVAVDGSGNVYVVDLENTTVTEINRATPPSLSFAATTVGATSSNSPQAVTVENVGNATLSFPIPSTGDNPSISANFTLNSSGESACPLVTASSSTAGMLAAGGECELAISFTPTAPATGNVTGSLAITDTNLNAGAPNCATQSIQLQGTAIPTYTLAILQSPTPGLGKVLGTSNVEFQWTAGTGVTLYQLNLSAIAPGDKELFSYKGTALTATATALPKNGIPVYATLYSYVDGTWQSNSYMYTESGTSPGILKSPTPGVGTVLGTSNVQFQWTTGAGVAVYQLNLSAIGAGQSELYSYKGTGTSAVVPTLPANGVEVYATLYSKINGVWQSNSYVYTESGTPTAAVLTSPTPSIGTILGSSNVNFQWTIGVDVADYQLNLSVVAPGDSDLYLYKGTGTSAVVPTLPANGVEVYARLYSKINGAWQYNDYQYTEGGTPTPATLTSPTPGISTILGTSNVTFQWTSGIAVTDYQLNLSAIAAGDSDLYTYKGTALTTTAPTIPANGAKVYARLYSKISGAWQYNDYVYTEQ